MRTLLKTFSAILLASVSMSAQQMGSTQEIHDFDTIDLSSLSVTLNVPVIVRGGPVQDSITLEGLFVLSPVTHCVGGIGCTQIYTPTDQFSPIYSAALGLIAWNTVTDNVFCGYDQGQPVYRTKYTNPYIVEWSGATHPLPTAWYWYNTQVLSCTNYPNMSGYALDNSGIYAVGPSGSLTRPNGHVFSINSNLQEQETDPNGNFATSPYPPGDGGATNGTTSLGQSFITTNVSATQFSYQDASNNPQSFTVNSNQLTLATNFGCTTGFADYPPTTSNWQTSLSYPDGTSLQVAFEPTAGKSGDYTGRIQTLTLPTGGTVTYTYSGGNAPGPGTGIYCSPYGPGSTPTLKRTLSDGSAWTYTTSYPSTSAPQAHTTTITDPAGNNVVHTFFGFTQPIEVQTQYYQGGGINCSTGCNSSNLLKTVTYCYNNLTTVANCANSSASPFNYPGTFYPGANIYGIYITEEDVYTTISGVTSPSEVATSYDGYGNITSVKTYDFGGTTPVETTTITYGSYNGTGCQAVGSQIVNLPCEVAIRSGSNLVSDVRYSYDSAGNQLSVTKWTGSLWLTSSRSYNANGATSTATDVAGTQATYGYGDCNNLLPTTASVGPYSYTYTWDCVSGALLSVTDQNTAATTVSYTANGADPFYRHKSVTGPLNEVASETYTSTSTKLAMTVGSVQLSTTSLPSLKCLYICSPSG